MIWAGSRSQSDVMRDTQMRTGLYRDRRRHRRTRRPLARGHRNAHHRHRARHRAVPPRGDGDIRAAASLPTDAAAYRSFDTRVRNIEEHGPTRSTPRASAGSSATRSPREPRVGAPAAARQLRQLPLPRAPDTHMRGPAPAIPRDHLHRPRRRAHQGAERGPAACLDPGLRDITRRENTFVRAETYWPAIEGPARPARSTSRVIGAQVCTHWIGDYTPTRAKALGKPPSPRGLRLR